MPEIRGCLIELERELYSRNIHIPEVGEEGQLKLSRSRVLIVGLGGLGSPALYYLAACSLGDALAMNFREIPLPGEMRCGMCRRGADLQPTD